MRETTATQYLKAIWRLEERGQTRIGVTTLTEHLGKSPATVSQAVRSLTATGLLTHERYGPITLTRHGRRIAVGAIRQERIARAFLDSVLSWPWPTIAEEAATLGTALNDELAERMHRTAGTPDTDPYGHPIPDPQGKIAEILDRPLSSFAAPATVHVTRVDDHDPDVLERFHALGIIPHTAVQIRRLDHATGVITLTTPCGPASIGQGSAEHISAIVAPATSEFSRLRDRRHPHRIGR